MPGTGSSGDGPLICWSLNSSISKIAFGRPSRPGDVATLTREFDRKVYFIPPRPVLEVAGEWSYSGPVIELVAGRAVFYRRQRTLRLPGRAGWLHAIEHDGFRILARRDAAGRKRQR